MTTESDKSSSRPRRQSVSKSTNESFSSGDEDDVTKPTSKSDQSSSDVTDLSGYTMNVDVEGDESPVMVQKRVRGGAACWHDSVDKDEVHMVTHQHKETLIRRPLHGRGAARTKDSYIKYTSQCTVISKQHKEGTNWTMHLKTAVVIICAIALVVLLLSFGQPSGSNLNAAHSKSAITLEMFLHAFNSVRESFQVQTSGFWGIIRAAVRPIVLQENPYQPAVFVLVVPSDAHKTAACFIRLFSDTIAGLFQTTSPVEFFTDAMSGLSPESVKRLLDDQLRNGLGSGGRVATVHHLELLHGESAMMLHAYCDNDNAPFRRIVFILALFVDETSSDVAETEAFVEQRLNMLWGETLGTNRFYPLLSRIAHSVVFMRPETEDVLAQIKC